MSAKTKKYRSKWFRVAVEGATTDGRTIERGQIQEMADSYNPDTYGARVWIEHLRSLLPDSPFRAYGDVTSVKAEEVTVDGKKKLALFAQIEPTEDLVNIVNGLRQKIYTSIELAAKFADTGKAYLMGLAVTDSPASLGTEALAFAAQHPGFLGSRKLSPDNIITAAEQVEVEFEEVSDGQAAPADSFMGRFANLFKTQPKPEPKPEAHAAGSVDAERIEQAFTSLLQGLDAQAKSNADLRRDLRELDGKFKALQGDYTALKAALGATEDHSQARRPPATGATGATATTDC